MKIKDTTHYSPLFVDFVIDLFGPCTIIIQHRPQDAGSSTHTTPNRCTCILHATPETVSSLLFFCKPETGGDVSPSSDQPSLNFYGMDGTDLRWATLRCDTHEIYLQFEIRSVWRLHIRDSLHNIIPTNSTQCARCAGVQFSCSALFAIYPARVKFQVRVQVLFQASATCGDLAII